MKPTVLAACVWMGLLAVPPAAHAWGCQGHQIVATIARGRLTPHARAQVDALLRNNPIDPSLKRFCNPKGLSRMQDGATWADDVKKSNGTDREHFVDVPRTDSTGDLAAACPGDQCITRAVAKNMDVLKSGAASGAQKADALRYLLHYAGDLHQPLHCIDNNDRGGNCVPVRGVKPPSKAKEPLHSAWDKEFVQQVMNGRSLKTASSGLAGDFAADIDGWAADDVDVDAWALETHDLGEDAYVKLPGGGPAAEPPVSPPITECPKPDPDPIVLDAAYRDAAAATVAQQLAKGGARLAVLLNSVWP